MTKASLSAIDLPWPSSDLERVEACPYCGSRNRAIAYRDVQDWSFYCAPGRWTYWDCGDCQALYLDPRPSKDSIWVAYKTYYTHTTHAQNHAQVSLFQLMKERLNNECLNHKYGAAITPRLHLPKALGCLLAPFEKRVAKPFGLEELATLPKTKFVDVGCGSGETVKLAQQLGWEAMGLEVDPAAVQAAQAERLNIIEGTYEQLDNYRNQFDCVMCSHVLEHVHNPRELLEKLRASLREGGVLLLSLPNSQSALRAYFGENWRGLEAPRHLAIPAQRKLVELLAELGFKVASIQSGALDTAVESYRIARRGLRVTRGDVHMAVKLGKVQRIDRSNNDFIKLVCKLP